MLRDPTRAELTDPERLLLAHLHRHCRGIGHARTYARLREDLEREQGIVITEREMYRLIQGLVLAGRPVGTISAGGGGAFIVETARDARLAYRNLYGRICRQLRRCRAFKRTCREGLSGQRFLDLREPGPRNAERGAKNETTASGPAVQGVLFPGLALEWRIG
jgi:hypothetical protein